jgi:radical SAM superfamily enzyme YgiQ (UPF0313 family)
MLYLSHLFLGWLFVFISILNKMKSNNANHLLLINPWIFDFTAFDLWSKPMGLLYIASFLENLGYKNSFIDCLDKHHPALLSAPENLKVKFKKFGTGPFLRQIVDKPDILDFIPRHFSRYGISEDLFLNQLKKCPPPAAILVTSFMTYWYLGPKRVVELCREFFPETPIILGGIYASLMPKHASDVIKPDFVLTGPGEIQIMELLSSIISGAPSETNRYQSLDDFPTPAFDLYSKLDYLPIMTSRGCPYRCTFCATDKISGPYAQRSADSVFSELSENVRRYQLKDVVFYDDALLLNKDHRLLPILEKVIKSKMKLRFHTPNGLHAKQIDRNVAELFRLSGFTTIRLSFETNNPQRFADMKNKVTPDDLIRAVENLEEVGYAREALETYILMGLPNQSFDEIYESLLFAHSLGIKIRLASFSPIPGTVDYNRAIEYGLFPEDADPLLTNKTIYPLHRSAEAFHKFRQIRQLVNVLNQAVTRKVNLFKPRELKQAFLRMIQSPDQK